MQPLLDKILKLVETDRTLQAQRIKDGDTFNVFSILGLQSYEVRTHSAFIGELLSPREFDVRVMQLVCFSQ